MDQSNENDDTSLQYSWVRDYEKSWEVIKEDSNGSLQSYLKKIGIEENRKRKIDNRYKNELINQKNQMVQHLLILLDASDIMLIQDLHPTRFTCTIKVVQEFVKKFFQKNPISQVGLAFVYADKTSTVIGLDNFSTEIDKKFNEIISESAKKHIFGTTISLQNCLEYCLQVFSTLPKYSFKQAIIITTNMTTTDHGDIFKSLEKIKNTNIIVSTISLTAEINILKTIATSANGISCVILNEHHFVSCLNKIVNTNSETNSEIEEDKACLIRMGFPSFNAKNENFYLNYTQCLCHSKFVKYEGYFCPNCFAKYCTIPKECELCGLLLIILPYLAKTQHNNLLIEPFIEISSGNSDTIFQKECSLCLTPVNFDATASFYTCERCKNLFCSTCELFIYESVGFCSFCH